MLTVHKTKEIISYFKKVGNAKMKNVAVEIVTEYKYLGTVIDSNLNWNRNTAIYNKALPTALLSTQIKMF